MCRYTALHDSILPSENLARSALPKGNLLCPRRSGCKCLWCVVISAKPAYLLSLVRRRLRLSGLLSKKVQIRALEVNPPAWIKAGIEALIRLPARFIFCRVELVLIEPHTLPSLARCGQTASVQRRDVGVVSVSLCSTPAPPAVVHGPPAGLQHTRLQRSIHP